MRNFGDSRSLVRQTAAQLARQQLAQQQKLAQQQQLAQQQLEQQQLLQQQQAELEEKYDALVTQFITITNSNNITINGPSHVVCDHVTVTGGNNQITTTGPTGMGPTGTTSPIGATPAPASVVGYFQITNYDNYPVTKQIPPKNNIAIVFYGVADPIYSFPNYSFPLELANGNYKNLQGDKYVCLGGNNGIDNAGQFNKSVLVNILTAINKGYFSGQGSGLPYIGLVSNKYAGIVFDIEQVSQTGLYDLSAIGYVGFKQVFAAAKKTNLKVIVTVSYTGLTSNNIVGDDGTLIQSILADSNVDYISPQLYQNGSEQTVDPTKTIYGPLTWDAAWSNTKIPLLPAIPWYQQYTTDFVQLFQNTLPSKLPTPVGYLQWNNEVYTGGGSPPGPISGPSITINITNSTKETMLIGNTTVNGNGGKYTTTLALPVTLTTTINSTPIINYADIACSVSELDINFGYGNSGVLTNILASGDFNGTSFSVGKNPSPSNKLSNAPTNGKNVLNVTYTDIQN